MDPSAPLSASCALGRRRVKIVHRCRKSARQHRRVLVS
jgi:hypothetical protein